MRLVGFNCGVLARPLGTSGKVGRLFTYYGASMILPRVKPTYFVTTCLLFCTASVVTRWQDLHVVAGSMKVLASASFLAYALAAGALTTTYGQRVFIGLVLAALGDVLLIGTSSMWFLAGLSSFLLAHVCYSVAFSNRGITRRILLLSLLPLTAFAATFVWTLWAHLPPVMRLPV